MSCSSTLSQEPALLLSMPICVGWSSPGAKSRVGRPRTQFGVLQKLKRPSPQLLSLSRTECVRWLVHCQAAWQLTLLAHNTNSAWRQKMMAGRIAGSTTGPDCSFHEQSVLISSSSQLHSWGFNSQWGLYPAASVFERK